MALSDRTPGIRSHPNFGRRLDIAWRYAFPGTTSFVLMLVSTLPIGFWGQAALLPAVVLTCVWFWSLYRPAAMSPPIVFLLGVLLDLLGYLPLGVGALTMLMTHAVAQALRRFLSRQGFAVIWLIFATVAVSVAAMTWVFVSFLTFSFVSPGPVLFQAGLAVAMHPAVAIPLLLAHRTIADPDLA